LRLSLAGGGTDLPEWYRGRGAHLLAVAIDRTVQVRPAAGPGDAGALVALARRLHPALGPLEVTSDVPGGSGLGGSGALATALVALGAHVAEDPLTPIETGLRAYTWERDLLGHPTGFQDHMSAALGGCVEMTATPGGDVSAVRRTDLEDALDDLLAAGLVLAASGVRRDAAPLLRGLAATLEAPSADTGGLATVTDVTAAVAARDGAALGEVFRAHWAAKLRLSAGAVWAGAASALDAAVAAGATGGKVVGAGGGGFLLCSGPASAAERVRAAVRAAGFVPVGVRVARSGVSVTTTS
jgi:D-glycero-alpha-D-manno-heptose-7-phosphate kinase